MVQLRVLDILKEQEHTKYWLYKRMDMSYQNFNKMVNNETCSIRFDNIDRLSKILDVPVGDLFEQARDAKALKE
ncbi:MAG: helix-turn-helix transcriptional regulator [Lachnospiraceae bacterium]|nr:helix-turn-helix transcriptional regulator [Lachnospiraceae bacterium]